MHGVLSSKFGIIGKFQISAMVSVLGIRTKSLGERGKVAKNGQKYQISLKTMAKRSKMSCKDWWCMELYWYDRQISNFGDGFSFGHQDMKLVVRAKMAKNYQKYQISVKTMVVVHET